MNFFGFNSIFFPPYVVSAILISVVWISLKTKCSIKDALNIFFSKKVWLSKSAFTDIQFSILIIVFVGYFLAQLAPLLFDLSLHYCNLILGHISVYAKDIKMPIIYEGLLATLITMLSIDFASFTMHRWMHKNSWLRKIHAIHHSAHELNFFTTYRQHILEPIILNSARTIAAAIGLSIFHLLFKSQTPVITYQGLGIGFFLYMFTVNLHHSHIPVNYSRLVKYIFISPHVHHLHHSKDRKHRDKNFGVIFSFWDRVFGSYHDEDVNLNELCFGLENSTKEISIKHSLQL
jgi:sterol desaturase/sphingolipid hydroxylase (fatty acid hydroxylase superfamily)